VTTYLNTAGAVALAAWCCDISVGRGMSPGGRRLRWMIWAVLAMSLALLAWLHPRLDASLDPEGFLVIDRARFCRLHRLYLVVSTVQWAGCGGLSALTIGARRDEDSAPDAGRPASVP
jgi:hypothetical protein